MPKINTDLSGFNRGFSLLELLIVIVIIGIITAIALPIYQTQVAKVQAMSGFAQISNIRTDVEVCIINAIDPTNTSQCRYNTATDLGNISVTGSTSISISMLFSSANNKTATPLLNGSSLVWLRSATGHWSCSSTINDNSISPGACQ